MSARRHVVGTICYRHDGASFLDGIDGQIDVEESRDAYEQAIADALGEEFPRFTVEVSGGDDRIVVRLDEEDDELDEDEIIERADEVVRGVYEAADWIVYADEEGAA